MSITMQTPNTISLGGDGVLVNDLPASAAITPGQLIERHYSSGMKWRKHATAGGGGQKAFALQPSMLNKTITDDYASGDLVEAMIGYPGATFYALIASGQNITGGALLESAGNGTLRVFASGVQIAIALESVNNSAGPADARIRVEAL